MDRVFIGPIELDKHQTFACCCLRRLRALEHSNHAKKLLGSQDPRVNLCAGDVEHDYSPTKWSRQNSIRPTTVLLLLVAPVVNSLSCVDVSHASIRLVTSFGFFF